MREQSKTRQADPACFRSDIASLDNGGNLRWSLLRSCVSNLFNPKLKGYFHTTITKVFTSHFLSVHPVRNGTQISCVPSSCIRSRRMYSSSSMLFVCNCYLELYHNIFLCQQDFCCSFRIKVSESKFPNHMQSLLYQIDRDSAVLEHLL